MKRKSKKLIVLGSALFATLFPFARVSANILGESIAGIGSSVIIKLVYGINLVIGFIAGIVFMLGGVLIDWTLKLNNHILDGNVNRFMITTWEMFLNFANLLMILAIIVIAFATVIRYESYGIKKILWRVIVAAILINFSLVMAGVVIDAAGLVTQFFVEKSNLGPANMSTILAGAFNSQQFFELKNQDPESYRGALDGGFVAGAFSAVASVTFVSLFTVIAAIVLLAIAFMLFMRFIHLSIRLAFLPVVIMAWIFPTTRKHWNKWWDDFIRWTMFAPAVTLMLYITIVALALNANTTHSSFKEINDSVVNGQAGQQIAGTLYFGVGAILNMAMGVGLLIASLMVANNFSITGAKTFNGWATNMHKGVSNWAKQRVRQTGTGLLRTKKAQELAKSMEDAGSKGNWLKRLATRPIRKAGQLANIAGSKQGQAMVKEGGTKIKGWSDDEKGRRIMDLPAYQQVAAIEDLVKNKKVDKINPDVLNRLLSSDGPLSLKAQMARYGKANVFENLEKLAGRNVAMVKAYNKNIAKNPEVTRINAEISRIQNDSTLSNDVKKARIKEQQAQLKNAIPESEIAKVRTEAKKFFGGFKEDDHKNISPAMLLGMKPADGPKKKISQDAITASNILGDLAAVELVKGKPGAMGSVYAKAQTEEYDVISKKFDEAIRKALDDYFDEADKAIREEGTTAQAMELTARLQEARKQKRVQSKIDALKEISDGMPDSEKLSDLAARAKGIVGSKKKGFNKRMFDSDEKEDEKEEGKAEKEPEKEPEKTEKK